MADFQGAIADRAAELQKIHDDLYALEKQLRSAADALAGATSEPQPESRLMPGQSQAMLGYAIEQINVVLGRVQAQANRLHMPK